MPIDRINLSKKKRKEKPMGIIHLVYTENFPKN